MTLSYWEIKSWLTNVDFTIVGSGIVGLSCALKLKEQFPQSKILVLEKGVLPQGASTKNAGFTCFGSLSEIIDDLNHHSEEDVIQLVKKRVNGLKLLRQTLGDKTIDYKELGGYELFLNSDTAFYEHCLEKQASINKLLYPLFNANMFSLKPNRFHFKNIKSKYSFNPFEGQIDTGKMMESLMRLVLKKGIKILNNCTVEGFLESTNSVTLKTNIFEYTTKKLFIATNGFASQLLEESLKRLEIQSQKVKRKASKILTQTSAYSNLDYRVKPARAQVLITKPIKDLQIKGTFHLDKGYYYFRNIDNRILLGGGRNLDFKTEETTNFGKTTIVQNTLEELLKTTILPNTDFEVDYHWSGIMGVGSQKQPIVKQLSNHVYCGVRLGGMGVAIGSLVGKDLAGLIE